MTLKQLIEENEISASLIAGRIAMPKSSFNNKLKGNNGARFTIGEIAQIEGVISAMCGKLTDDHKLYLASKNT